jgi:hypothetical protein
MPEALLELPAPDRQEAFNFAASQTGDTGQSFRLRCAFSALPLQPSAERYSEGVRRCEAHVRSVSQRGGL